MKTATKVQMGKVTLRSVVLLLMAALFLVQTARAEAGNVTEVAPEERVRPMAADMAAFIDQYVEEGMADAHAPGLVVTVVYGGEVVVAQGYGVADVETGRPMTARTNLRAGSVSKAVTSAGVLELAAGGRVSLEERMSAYLPGLLPEDGYGPAGTVAQFLTLQGGYADVVVETHAPTPEGWQPLDIFIEEQLPARVMPPGKVYSYSSWEHALLGRMMAEVTGKRFDEAMADLVFRPLGMEQSTFAQPLPGGIAANLAAGYAFDGGTYEEVPLDYVKLSPGIALVTTGKDMGRFMVALLNGGVLEGERVLAPETVEGMLQRQEGVHARSRGRTYGLSEITLGGQQALYHDGNGIGHGNRMILVPEHGLGIFLSTNHRPLAHDVSSTPAYTFMKGLGTALLKRYVPARAEPGSVEEEAPLPPLPEAAGRAARYAGHYRLASTPQEDFFKLGALLDNVNVADNGDGTITVGSNRYAEVEPLLFQSKSDPGFFVVFVEDDAGEIGWLTFGGTGSYQRVSWYETPTVQLALVAMMLLGFLSFVVLMPFSSRRHWQIWLMSALGLAFLAGLATMMTNADLVLFFKRIPLGTKVLFALPWLSGGLALTLPAVLVSLWRKRATGRVWLLYGLNAVAAAGFLWFVVTWNLYLK